MIARMLMIPILVSWVAAQTGDTLTGKVVRTETKGKTTKLTIATDAGEQTFDLLPKVELEIVSTGDDACLAKGLFVKVDAVESNQKYFGTVLSVYPEHEGRVPPANPVNAPPEPGQSVNRYFISGEIAKFAPNPDEKYDALELKTVGKGTLPLYVERQHSVRIVQTDVKHIAEGQPVTVAGKKTGSKFLPSKVTIETGEALKGEELLPTIKKKK